MEMVNRRSWQEFRESGLLWWVNRILHTFGWAIVVDVDKGTGVITDCYPACVRFRGFDEKSETEGFKKISIYMKNSSDHVIEDSNL